MDYKITIFGRNIYKEALLPQEQEGRLLIGTAPECQIRFSRERSFADFILTIKKQDGQWVACCTPGIYLHTGASVKQYMLALSHGDLVEVFYEETQMEVFRIEFMRDYERRILPYDKYIDLSDKHRIRVGQTPDCDLRLQDPGIQQDFICLEKSKTGYILDAANSRYGVRINGYQTPHPVTEVSVGTFFALAGCSFFLDENRLYLSAQCGFVCVWPVVSEPASGNTFCYPKFVRNARICWPLPKEQPEILGPKSAPQEPQKNLLMTLVPVLASVGLIVLLRGILGNGGSFVMYSVAMMALGGVMSVWNYIHEGREYRRKMEDRTLHYNTYLQGQEQKLIRLREREQTALERTYLTVQQDLEMMLGFDEQLFERGRGDADFLEVYLGKGVRRSSCPVSYRALEYKDTEDPLQDYPQMLAEKYAYLAGAPITLNLNRMYVVGITGTRSKLYQIAKNITLDLGARQFYQDVKLFYILNREDADVFRWMRWLAHAWNEDRETRNFMYDEESGKQMLEYLYGELCRREQLEKGAADSLPIFVIFVYRQERLMTHPVSKYIGRAGALGFRFLFFSEHRHLLPPACACIISLDSREYKGMLKPCENGSDGQEFSYQRIPSGQAAAAAGKLAGIYVDEVHLESTLTKSITLYQLLGIMAAPELDLAKNWACSRVYETMAAPIGVAAGDEVVYLDLHEKFHGPHGLVAGTTGSGKSELLQTYILSMAILFHPYEVSFVIIDFKGGGMVNQFANLPHLNGAITNIDGREIARSLSSIKAELHRRQSLFAKYGVNHIDAYIRLYKQQVTPVPLPHLILIVDEFAELKVDQPEFMKELISAARIGRSLGVHLILATQKPSGVVDAQIWSNSRFHLCLKVAGKEDSNEVLKSPLAAEIRETGRGYLQVGNNEIFTLFQSAYSGAPVNADADNRSYEINRISFSGKRIPIFIKKPGKNGAGEETQLDALVAYIQAYCRQANIEKLAGICLPPLPEVIGFDTKMVKTRDADAPAGTRVPLGIYDDPDHQLQETARMDLLVGHLLIVGSASSGKTNLLMLLVRALGAIYTSSQVWIYILDFGSMALKNFESLDHVGGVVLASEDEKLKNLIKMLVSVLKKRKETFSDLGMTSFSSYREAGYTDLPHILVLVDNFLALKELYPEYDEPLLQLLREGISVGITLILTSMQTGGISYRYMSNISNRICLHCNQKDEYANVLDGCRMEPRNLPGRGLLKVGKGFYEYQGFLAFEGEKEIQRVEHMKRIIKQQNQRNTGYAAAARIPMVPEIVTSDLLHARYGVQSLGAYQVPAGVDYEEIGLFVLDLAHMGTLSLMGKQTDRENLTAVMMGHFYRHIFDQPVRVWLMDDSSRRLCGYEKYGFVERYSTNAGDVIPYVEEIHELLVQREEDGLLLLSDQEDRIDMSREMPLLVLVIQNRESIRLLSKDTAALKLYKEVIGKYQKYGVCVIYTDLEDAAVPFSGPEILKMLREQRNLMYFDDLAAYKFSEVPNQVLRNYKKERTAYDAYVMRGGSVTKVKTVVSQ